MDEVDRGYLTEEEIKTIMEKQFDLERLERTRDLFIFSCFTGLAYIDVKALQCPLCSLRNHILLNTILNALEMLKSHFADKKDGKTLSVFQEKYLNLHRLFSLYAYLSISQYRQTDSQRRAES